MAADEMVDSDQLICTKTGWIERSVGGGAEETRK